MSIVLLSSAVLNLSAQMSEDKIIQFVAEQQSKGVPQEQIVFELSRRGVTMQQLQSMREKYEKQKSTGVLGNTMLESEGLNSRVRTQNSTMNLMESEEEKIASTKLTEEEKLQMMYNESMFLFVD